MYTGRYGVERHHVFSHTPRERKLCEKYGFVAPLAPYLHPNGVHRGKVDKDLRKRCRDYYIEHYGTEEQFREEFFYVS